MKKGDFHCFGYSSNYVNITTKRMAEIVKIGDIIEGNEMHLRTSSRYSKFIVTFVDHWGVMAVPTEEFMSHFEHMKKDKAWYSKAKGHHKFKWCHITAIDLK